MVRREAWRTAALNSTPKALNPVILPVNSSHINTGITETMIQLVSNFFPPLLRISSITATTMVQASVHTRGTHQRDDPAELDGSDSATVSILREGCVSQYLQESMGLG